MVFSLAPRMEDRTRRASFHLAGGCTLAARLGNGTPAPSGGTSSIDPEAPQLLLIECDAQPSSFRYAGCIRSQRQGLGEQVGLVVMGAEDIGRVGGAGDVRHG